MAVSASDLKMYNSANNPAPDNTTGTVGGAIDTGNEVDDIIDEILYTIVANETGGGTKTRYTKVFIKNEHGTDAYYGIGSTPGPHVWITTTGSPGNTWAIGIGSPTDTTTQGSAPSDVVFNAQTGSESEALYLDSQLGAGSTAPLWFRVQLTEDTEPSVGDHNQVTFRIKGDTVLNS